MLADALFAGTVIVGSASVVPVSNFNDGSLPPSTNVTDSELPELVSTIFTSNTSVSPDFNVLAVVLAAAPVILETFGLNRSMVEVCA